MLYSREQLSPNWRKRLSTASIVAQHPLSSSFSSLDVLEEVDLTDFRIPHLNYAEEEPQKQTCSICFEDYGSSDMARLPDCNHAFCCECLTGHVRAKLSDMVFPIYCPLCVLNLAMEDPTGASSLHGPLTALGL
jgi:hypothetical protein